MKQVDQIPEVDKDTKITKHLPYFIYVQLNISN